MSRYIDADAFIDDLYEHEFSNWCDKDEVSTLVNDAPSIDIVRCSECKYNSICNHGVQHTTHDAYSVTIGSKTVEWCSYGERKESE